MRYVLAVIFSLVVLLTGCVTSKTVSKASVGDHSLTCNQLQFEISNMEQLKNEFESDSGLTGKNVGMALIFWPGILVNEMNANKNVNSVVRRLDHLNQIYTKKCV